MRGVLCVLVVALAPGFSVAGEVAPALTLQQAYEMALARSETVRLAEIAADQARLHPYLAWSLLGPTATVSAQGILQKAVYIDTANKGDPPHLQSAVLPLQSGFFGNLNQPLFRRGFSPARTAGLALSDSAEATTAWTRQQLRYDVAKVFFQVLKGRQLVDVAQQNRQRTEFQLKVATVKKSLGEVVKSAVVQAQIDVYRADTEVIDAQALVDDAAATFERLVGIPPPALTPPSQALLPGREEALRMAMQRSDLRSLRALVVQARGLAGVANAAPWPTLDLQGLFSQFLPVPELSFNPSGFTGRALLVLTIPLFQTGSEYVNIKLAKLDELAAVQRVALLEKTAREDVARGLVALDARTRDLAVADLLVGQARENYALVQAQFKNGKGTSTDVTVAQSTLAAAESQEAAARFERELAAYQLLFAAGQI